MYKTKKKKSIHRTASFVLLKSNKRGRGRERKSMRQFIDGNISFCFPVISVPSIEMRRSLVNLLLYLPLHHISMLHSIRILYASVWIQEWY